MMIAASAIDQRTVDVVSPDSCERAYIAGHSRHEARDQRRDSKAEQPRAAISGEHERENVVVAMAASYSGNRLRDQLFGKQGQAQQAGQDYDERSEERRVGKECR